MRVPEAIANDGSQVHASVVKVLNLLKDTAERTTIDN